MFHISKITIKKYRCIENQVIDFTYQGQLKRNYGNKLNFIQKKEHKFSPVLAFFGANNVGKTSILDSLVENKSILRTYSNDKIRITQLKDKVIQIETDILLIEVISNKEFSLDYSSKKIVIDSMLHIMRHCVFFWEVEWRKINKDVVNFLLDKVFRSENVKISEKRLNPKLSIFSEFGIRELYRLATPFIDILKNGGFFVVDNLGFALNPMVVNFLVECFKRKDINTGGGTLIFSSHNYDVVDVLDYDNIFTVSKAYGKSYIENITPQPNKEKFKKELRYGYYGGQCEITSLDFFAKELKEFITNNI
jgi:hypothetical protein